MSSSPQSERRGVLLVCSCGGHLLQMLELRSAWEDRPRTWVTFDKADARSLLGGEDVTYAHGPTNRNLGNFLRNIRLAHKVIRARRPGVVLSTGAGVAVPFAWIGRLYGARVVFVESLTRIEGLSLSGRMISPIAEQVYVQWPEATEAHPRAVFAGNLFATS
jgi:beta-1,4-N-acetylglucosaminyltransferase